MRLIRCPPRATRTHSEPHSASRISVSRISARSTASSRTPPSTLVNAAPTGRGDPSSIASPAATTAATKQTHAKTTTPCNRSLPILYLRHPMRQGQGAATAPKSGDQSERRLHVAPGATGPDARLIRPQINALVQHANGFRSRIADLHVREVGMTTTLRAERPSNPLFYWRSTPFQARLFAARGMPAHRAKRPTMQPLPDCPPSVGSFALTLFNRAIFRLFPAVSTYSRLTAVSGVNAHTSVRLFHRRFRKKSLYRLSLCDHHI